MSTRKLILCMKAILETLSEVDGAPESTIYLPFSMQNLLNLDEFQVVLGHLVTKGWVKTSHNWVEITPKGLALLAEAKAVTT